MRRIGRFFLILFGCLMVAASPTFAQLDLDELYEAPDESFEFLYPSDWDVNDDDFEDLGLVSLSGDVDGTAVFMNFFGSELIGVLAPQADSVEEIVEEFGESLGFEDSQEIDFDGRDAVVANVVFESGSTGIGIVVEFAEEGFGLIMISADEFSDEVNATVISIAFSFNNLGANGADGGSSGGLGGLLGGRTEGEDEGEENSNNNNSSSDLPSELSDFGGEWSDAIAELEDAGLIGSGGALIFNENRAFFDGVGSWFTPLARRSQRRDVVMAAELTLTSDSRDFETCSIMARILDSGGNSVNTYLEVGFTNDGEVFWVDVEDGDFNSDAIDLNLDLDESHHVLLLAQLDELSIYVDGELVFEKIEINERSGYFGIALLGEGAGSRCEGDNIWAYDAPVLIPGFCEAVAPGTVNKRSGPGTDFDRAGTMNGGERLEVVGQAESSDGFIWYELEDDSWVREDVISLQGDCSDIPESEE